MADHPEREVLILMGSNDCVNVCEVLREVIDGDETYTVALRKDGGMKYGVISQDKDRSKAIAGAYEFRPETSDEED